MVTLIGVKIWMTVDLSSGHKVSLLVAISLGVTKCETKKGERVGFWPSKKALTANISKTVSLSVTSITLTSARQHISKKCKLRCGSPPPPMGVHYKQKCVAVLSISAILAVRNAKSRTHCRATHDWSCRVYLSDDGGSDYHTCGPTPLSAVIDRYFVKHHLHWTPLLILIVNRRLDRGVQSATEMLPLIRVRGRCTYF